MSTPTLHDIIGFSSKYKSGIVTELYDCKDKKQSLKAISARINKDLSKAVLNELEEKDLTPQKLSESASQILIKAGVDEMDDYFEELVALKQACLSVKENAYTYLEKNKANLVLPYYFKKSSSFKGLRKLHTPLKDNKIIHCNSFDFETIFSSTNPLKMPFEDLIKTSKRVMPVQFAQINFAHEFINKLDAFIVRSKLGKFEYARGLVSVQSKLKFDLTKLKDGKTIDKTHKLYPVFSDSFCHFG